MLMGLRKERAPQPRYPILDQPLPDIRYQSTLWERIVAWFKKIWQK